MREPRSKTEDLSSKIKRALDSKQQVRGRKVLRYKSIRNLDVVPVTQNRI